MTDKKITLLLVDDEKDLLDSLERMLRMKFDVTTTSSPNEAYAIIDSKTKKFDVIISDLLMQEMTGMDLYEKIKTSYPGLEKRIVFMTGGIYTELTNNFLNSVSNPSIEKPFKIGELIKLIESVANQPIPLHGV